MEEKYLCYVKYVGTNINEENIYALLFTDKVDEFWFENAEYKPLGLLSHIEIDEDTYDFSKTIETSIKLDLVQESTCFGFQDCVDNIVALAYENIDGYEEYPEEGRIVLHYGMSYNEVEEMLVEKSIVLK